MNKNTHPKERGQAVVLIVVAMVVLLGFTAVAVDGSMVYSDRRYAQNSADASSLAGASTAAKNFEAANITYANWTASPPNCTGAVQTTANTGLSAGRKRATDNGFTIDTDLSDRHGIKAECKVENLTAPVVGGGSATIFVDKFIDFTAEITADTQTAFAHLVFGGPLRNTVTAITRVRPRSPLAYGYAIVALNPAACSGNQNGINFHGLGGGGGLIVDGGGVFSNGCMDVDGNPDVLIKNAGAFYFFTANNNDLDDIQFDPTNQAEQLVNNDAYRIPLNAYDIEPPDCSGHEVTSNWVTSYWNNHNAPIPSGLYCVTDQLRINAHDRVEAYEVTFVLYNGMRMNGNATVKMTTAMPGYQGDAIPGLVIYQPPTSSSEIQFNGNAGSTFRGSVVAPKATIDFVGNLGFTGFWTQLIGWNVYIGGSSDTEVIYRAQKLTTLPARLELNR